MPPKPTSVLIADKSELIRCAVLNLLRSEFAVICVDSAQMALENARIFHTSIVMTDIALADGGNGFDLARRLRRLTPRPKVVLFTERASEEIYQESLRAGCCGYILKNKPTIGILYALRKIRDGFAVYPEEVRRFSIAPDPPPFAGTNGHGNLNLSRRETETVRLFAEGLTTKEIAVRLGVGARTAETYRQNAMRKSGQARSALLVRWAIRQGLVEP